ncbi:hypothetical protein V5799_025789 [Amblyomma americanum]|uniref:BTB domain-containing protein n=1 Tax=Amblyomma americanum TaxID=6943 RepID=A0AAQ4E8I9_AMBAM
MRYMDLKAIVEFMYRGEVNVSQDNFTALLKTAESLKVIGLAGVTNENKDSELVTSVDGAVDVKPVGVPRAESPPLRKRKRGRPRRRSPSDSNKSDSEDAPPAARIKAPDSPEIIEDGGMSSDRVTGLPAPSSSRTSDVAASSSPAVPSGAHHGSSVQASISQHTQDSIGDDVGECDDADFDVEPLNVMEESMTTEDVPVFLDVSSSQAPGDESQQSRHTGSTSDNRALVPVHPLLPSDISIASQVDIKPSPSSLIPYGDQTLSPVVSRLSCRRVLRGRCVDHHGCHGRVWRSCHRRPVRLPAVDAVLRGRCAHRHGGHGCVCRSCCRRPVRLPVIDAILRGRCVHCHGVRG